jgi:L-iditol 2-dehydrogenase
MNGKMKVAVTLKPGEIKYEERPIPSPADDEVLLKIKYTGICGSDIHIYAGEHPFVGPECYPLVQGHESVAYVEELGKNVQGFKKGDYVTAMPQVACGECELCKTGRLHICSKLKVLGNQCDGFFSEYFPVKADMVIKLPDIPEEEAAMVEPLAVAVGAVRKLGPLAGKRVLVYGAGVIGNLCGQVARACGAAEVAIADLIDERLDLAVNKCGIDTGINTAKVADPAAAYSGYDFHIECIGIEATIRNAIQYVKKGGMIVVAGVFGKEVTIPIALVQDREICIKGTLMYEKEDYIAAINLIKTKRVKLRPLIFKVVPFDEYDKAYDLIKANKALATKVLVKIG